MERAFASFRGPFRRPHYSLFCSVGNGGGIPPRILFGISFKNFSLFPRVATWRSRKFCEVLTWPLAQVWWLLATSAPLYGPIDPPTHRWWGKNAPHAPTENNRKYGILRCCFLITGIQFKLCTQSHVGKFRDLFQETVTSKKLLTVTTHPYFVRRKWAGSQNRTIDVEISVPNNSRWSFFVYVRLFFVGQHFSK